MSRVDLHIHSTASDGKFTPGEIVRKAVESGLTVISLADHDTVDGIAPALEAAQAFPELTVIAGIEINTDVPHGEAHILGYFLDYTSHELEDILGKLRYSRRRRAQRMIDKLHNLGIYIEWQRVQELSQGSSIGRPHIAQAMLEKGYVKSFKEAFTRYIGRDGPAYVEREKVTPVEAVQLILRTNGLPVLAHPFTITEPEKMIAELKSSGLVGIEAYYDHYTVDEVERLVSLASKYSLIATGGSDFHGLETGFETALGCTEVPIEVAEQLIALAKQRALKSVP